MFQFASEVHESVALKILNSFFFIFCIESTVAGVSVMQEVENWKKFCKKNHINFQLQEAVKEALFGSYAKTDGLIPTTADF